MFACDDNGGSGSTRLNLGRVDTAGLAEGCGLGAGGLVGACNPKVMLGRNVDGYDVCIVACDRCGVALMVILAPG